MKKFFTVPLLLGFLLALSACGQTSSINFKGNRTSSGLPVEFAPGSGVSNGGFASSTTALGNTATLSIGAAIGQVSATSTGGIHATYNITGQTSR